MLANGHNSSSQYSPFGKIEIRENNIFFYFGISFSGSNITSYSVSFIFYMINHLHLLTVIYTIIIINIKHICSFYFSSKKKVNITPQNTFPITIILLSFAEESLNRKLNPKIYTYITCLVFCPCLRYFWSVCFP